MNEIQSAIEDLGSDDGRVREAARNALVATKGHEVVHALIAILTDPRRRVRWEAAKALSEIGDPEAALPLAHAMDDDDNDVAWIAAEGIAEMGEAGLLAVLHGLTRASRSGMFCRVARHALNECRHHGMHRKYIAPVIAALKGPEPRLDAPIAAYRTLQALRAGSPVTA